MSGFYTRKGDDGFTGVLGEGRVAKFDLVPETLGNVDEATAALGLARALCQGEGTAAVILQIQRHLYGLMAEVAATPENVERFHVIEESHVTWLEEQTALFAQKAPVPKEFIVPGDTPVGGALDLARTIVRRAERRLAEFLHRGGSQNLALLHYLNRLSSLIFVMEIYENQVGGQNKLTLARNKAA